MTTLRRTRCLALVGALLLPSTALAQTAAAPPPVSAEEHFALGNRLFAQRMYAAATREFQAAYAAEHRVELLFNIGRSMEEDGQLRLALDAYRRFIQSMPVDFDRAPLRARITEIERRLASEPAPRPPAAAAAPVPPPPRRPAAPATALRTGGPPGGAVALLVVGGAALVTGAVLGYVSGAALDGCRVEGDVARCRDQAALDRATDAPGFAAAANVSFALGAAALVAGGTWWLLAPSRRVTVAAGPRAVSLAVRW